MSRVAVVHVRRAVEILRAGLDTALVEEVAHSRVAAARLRLADYLEQCCADARSDVVTLPSARKILTHAGCGARRGLPFADGTTEAALVALVGTLLTTPGAPRFAPPRHDAFLQLLRGHPDSTGETVRRACLDTILGRGVAPPGPDAGPDERGAALATLLRLAGVLRPAALDLLPAEPLRRRDGHVMIAHPSTLLTSTADHEIPLDMVTQVAWTVCRAAGVEPRDDEAWLARHGHSLHALPAVARLRWRWRGLDDWLALHLTGEQPCVPPDDRSPALEQGWLPLLLRGEMDDAALPTARRRTTSTSSRPNAEGAESAEGAADAADVTDAIADAAAASAITGVSKAAGTPIRSGRTFRRMFVAAVRDACRAIARTTSCGEHAPPREVARALAAPPPQDGALALYTLLRHLEHRAAAPIITPRRKRKARDAAATTTKTSLSARAAEALPEGRRLRARSIAAYWQDGLAILRAMTGVPLRDWTPETLMRAFGPTLAYETHRRRARLLAAWAGTAGKLLPFPAHWVAPPCVPHPRAQLLISPGQINRLLEDLRDYSYTPHDGTTREQRAGELVVLVSLIVLFRCRVREAATRLYCDLAADLGTLYIPAADAKGRRTTSRPRGWLLPWAEVFLLDYRAQAEAASTTTRQPLLPSATDHAALRRLMQALHYHLDRHGITPHDLRHAGITADIVLVIALRVGEPAPALQPWEYPHRTVTDPMPFTAARGGHAFPVTTATTYTHCALWALTRIMATWHDPLVVCQANYEQLLLGPLPRGVPGGTTPLNCLNQA